ncbi:hypothetical protein [Paenibacillus sp. FSL R10-2778]|uniref:hypothetical protein n=1 Tax=unclassified Paenibacillus TaxID=185978 RepID=UPI003158C288
MFNKRWKKILIWTLSVLVVLGVGGLFAANYAVDKLMNSMAEGLDLESEDTVTDVRVEEVVDSTPTATPVSTFSEPVETPMPVVEPLNGSTEVGATNPPIASQKKGNNKTQATPTITIQPSIEPSKEVSNSTDEGYTAQISADKAKKIQDNVTVKEKADVASIVLGQLSVADIKRLKELASGGLTLDEKREARSIILDKVSEEQYNELSQIAKKYGVSQGKTRDQIIAEEEQLKAIEKGSE